MVRLIVKKNMYHFSPLFDRESVCLNVSSSFSSKAAIKLTKVRLEMINRKRDAMLKFLKKDIADLLKKDLDSNAYGRVIHPAFSLPHFLLQRFYFYDVFGLDCWCRVTTNIRTCCSYIG